MLKTYYKEVVDNNNVVFNDFKEVTNLTKQFNKYMKENNLSQEDAIFQFTFIHYENDFKGKVGQGAYIVLDNCVKNKKVRPYVIQRANNNGGVKKFTKVYKWYTNDNKCVCKCYTTKKDAIDMVKDMYKDGTLQESVKLFIEKEMKGENSPVVTANYSPTNGTKKGLYFVFGEV